MKAQQEALEQLFRVGGVAEKFGVSKATIWNWTKDNPHFPKPIKISSRITVWRLSELDDYISNHLFA